MPDLNTGNRSLGIKEILLNQMGGFITAITIVVVSFLGSQYLGAKQAIDSNFRLYAQMMSSREEADSSLRQGMFQSTLDRFLSEKKEEISGKEQLLQLQLLAYNFHNALDLGPLFEYLYDKFRGDPNILKRIKDLSEDIKGRQIALLVDIGDERSGDIYADMFEEGSIVTLINDVLTLKRPNSKRHFSVELLNVRQKEKRFQIRLRISSPSNREIDLTSHSQAKYLGEEEKYLTEIDEHFWVGMFDFPTTKNLRLSNGDRCAVFVRYCNITREENDTISYAQLCLTYFPGSRASLKEKPYYDEIIDQLRNRDHYKNIK